MSKNKIFKKKEEGRSIKVKFNLKKILEIIKLLPTAFATIKKIFKVFKKDKKDPSDMVKPKPKPPEEPQLDPDFYEVKSNFKVQDLSDNYVIKVKSPGKLPQIQSFITGIPESQPTFKGNLITLLDHKHDVFCYLRKLGKDYSQYNMENKVKVYLKTRQGTFEEATEFPMNWNSDEIYKVRIGFENHTIFVVQISGISVARFKTQAPDFPEFFLVLGAETCIPYHEEIDNYYGSIPNVTYIKTGVEKE